MVDEEKKVKRILICCAAGMSSSILVKSMRDTASKLNINIKIGAVNIGNVDQYIGKVDYILLAPQIEYEYNNLLRRAKRYDVEVLKITHQEYGRLEGKSLLLRIQNDLTILEEEIEMDRLSKGLEKHILPFASKLGGNPILGVIRDGMSATVALLILGSISILLTNFPHEGIASLLSPANAFFNTIYAFTSGVLGLITTMAIAHYASIHYKTARITSVMTAVIAFLITQSEIVDDWPTLNVDGLGVSGLMTGIIVALISVKILEVFETNKIGIKMPDGVPEAISDSFVSLIPAIIIAGGFTFLTTVLGFNLNELIGLALSPLSSFLNTMPGYILYHMLCGLVFFFGINSAVVIGIFMPFLTANSLANEAAYAAGKSIPFIATNAVDTMIWAGGTGATIGLTLLMVFTAKSKMMKTLGKISIWPSIFNINEPVIFGIPIAFNPLFLVPFVLTPGIIAGITYFLMSSGIIAMPVLGNIPWTLPPVVAGYAMSGGAISTTIWSALIVIISLAIYYPFFRIADKQMYEKELAESQNS